MDNRNSRSAIAALVVFALLVTGAWAWILSDEPDSAGQESALLPTPEPTPEPTSALVPPTSDGASVVLRAADLPDGRSWPKRFRVFNNGATSGQMAVRDGVLRHGKPTAGNAASYMETDLGAPTERIGATFSFDGQGGAVALVAWESSLVSSRENGTPWPSAGIHFVVTPTSWTYGLWTGAATENLTTETFRSPLVADGTEYSIEVRRDGDTVTIVEPDGTTSEPLTDPRVELTTGAWATWELYESDPTGTPAVLHELWAS